MDRQQVASTAEELTALQRELSFPLPSGTRIVWIERQSGIDDMLRVKLEMSQSDFDSIESKLPFAIHDLSPGAGRLGADKGQWNPQSIAGLRSAQIALPNARFLNIGIAEVDRVVTLFVTQHGT